jgi:hypothetical protein
VVCCLLLLLFVKMKKKKETQEKKNERVNIENLKLLQIVEERKRQHLKLTNLGGLDINSVKNRRSEFITMRQNSLNCVLVALNNMLPNDVEITSLQFGVMADFHFLRLAKYQQSVDTRNPPCQNQSYKEAYTNSYITFNNSAGYSDKSNNNWDVDVLGSLSSVTDNPKLEKRNLTRILGSVLVNNTETFEKQTITVMDNLQKCKDRNICLFILELYTQPVSKRMQFANNNILVSDLTEEEKESGSYICAGQLHAISIDLRGEEGEGRIYDGLQKASLQYNLENMLKVQEFEVGNKNNKEKKIFGIHSYCGIAPVCEAIPKDPSSKKSLKRERNKEKQAQKKRRSISKDM